MAVLLRDPSALPHTLPMLLGALASETEVQRIYCYAAGALTVLTANATLPEIDCYATVVAT